MMMTKTNATEVVHLPYEISEARAALHKRRRDTLVELVEYAREAEGVPPANFRVLDVGCGRGELMAHLRSNGFDAQGVDLDPECVEISSQHGPCQISTVEQLPEKFDENQFDLVVASHVLEHTLSPLDAVSCLNRTSNKWLILAVPNPIRPHILLKNLLRKNYSNRGHVVAWDRSHFDNFLTQYAGLTIERWATDHVRFVGHSLLQKGIAKYTFGAIEALEVKFLPKLFPYFSDSLITLCRVEPSPDNGR